MRKAFTSVGIRVYFVHVLVRSGCSNLEPTLSKPGAHSGGDDMPQCGEAGAVRQVTQRFTNSGFETSPGRIRRTRQPAPHQGAGFCFSGRRDTLGAMPTPPDARVHAVPLPAAAARAAEHP